MHSGLREPVLFDLLSRKTWPAMGCAGATCFGLAMGAECALGRERCRPQGCYYSWGVRCHPQSGYGSGYGILPWLSPGAQPWASLRPRPREGDNQGRNCFLIVLHLDPCDRALSLYYRLYVYGNTITLTRHARHGHAHVSFLLY